MNENLENKKLDKESIKSFTLKELGRVKAKLGTRIIDFAKWYKEERLNRLKDLAEKIAVCTVYAFTIILVICLIGVYGEMFWLSIVLFIQWTFIFIIIFQHYNLKYETIGIDHKNAYDYFEDWKYFYRIKEDEFIID